MSSAPVERGELVYWLLPGAEFSCTKTLLSELFLLRPNASLILLFRLGLEVLSAMLLPPGVKGRCIDPSSNVPPAYPADPLSVVSVLVLGLGLPLPLPRRKPIRKFLKLCPLALLDSGVDTVVAVVVVYGTAVLSG